MSLTLPTSVDVVLPQVWRPAMQLLPDRMRSARADLIGLTIGGQESGYRARVQMGGGPARSFWQFEMGGVGMCTPNGNTCWGVLNHPQTRGPLASACAQLGVVDDHEVIYAALATNDMLGAVLARLLIWTDPGPLPLDRDGAYALYLRLWRPGKPDDSRWPPAYEAALHALAD